MALKARKFVLTSKFVGMPNLSNFKLVEETLPTLNDGEILAKSEWLTVDPYMRARFMEAMKIGDEFGGTQVATVIQSRCPVEFPVGTKVLGGFGWRDLTIYKPDPNGPRNWRTIWKLQDMKGLPDSYALGCLGMPGMTAFLGLTEIIKPKEGETLVVSAAAGAVGSIVGQVGKLKGCKVIGFAGSEDKVKWLKEELGFDLAFNYKSVNVDATLKQYVPEGIDCYFDNVGGEFAYDVVENMNSFGRIAQCGSISSYNAILPEGERMMEPINYKLFRKMDLSLLGFQVYRWNNSHLYVDGIKQIRDWIIEGKIKVHETITEGFENMPQAFIDLLEGKNTGKQIVKV